MRKLGLPILALLTALAFSACGPGQAAASTAEKFLKAFYALDFVGAKVVSTDTVKAMLAMVEGATKAAQPGQLDGFRKTTFAIGAVEVSEDGLTATVRYTLRRPESEVDEERTMELENGKEGWRVANFAK